MERGGTKTEGAWLAITSTLSSLVPRPEEEEKGPGFSRWRMRLIAVEFHRLRILLIYFCTLVTPESTLNVTLEILINSARLLAKTLR